MKSNRELQAALADKLSQCADLLCKVAEEGVKSASEDAKKAINLKELRRIYADRQ